MLTLVDEQDIKERGVGKNKKIKKKIDDVDVEILDDDSQLDNLTDNLTNIEIVNEEYVVDRLDKELEEPAFYKMRVSEYRDKLLPHIQEFKDMINNSPEKEITIPLKQIKEILGEDYRTKSAYAIYSRCREVLLENGIEIHIFHQYGANLIMSLTDMNKNEVIRWERSKYLNSALNAGFLTNAEYKRHQKGYVKKLKHGIMEESIDTTLYLGSYVKRKFLSKLFPDAVPNPVPLGPYSRRSYDWICKNGIKIKFYSSTLRTRYDPSDLNWTTGEIRKREVFQWNIMENKDADVFILIAWKDRQNLELLHVWIINKDDIVNGRKFNERQSFAVNNHKFSLNKYKKFEIDITEIEEYIYIDRKNKRNKEINDWYNTIFRTIG